MGVESLRKADMKQFNSPSAAEATDLLPRLDLSDPKCFTYCMEESVNFPFNANARGAFYAHFKRSVERTNWLTRFEFDKRLVLPETVFEGFNIALKAAKASWKEGRVEKPRNELADQLHRRQQRKYTVSQCLPCPSDF